MWCPAVESLGQHDWGAPWNVPHPSSRSSCMTVHPPLAALPTTSHTCHSWPYASTKGVARHVAAASSSSDTPTLWHHTDIVHMLIEGGTYYDIWETWLTSWWWLDLASALPGLFILLGVPVSSQILLFSHYVCFVFFCWFFFVNSSERYSSELCYSRFYIPGLFYILESWYTLA